MQEISKKNCIKDVETIPWKACANNFYSRIAMRWKKNTKKQQQPKKKKQRIDWVQRTSDFFLCTQQRMNKSCSSTFHGLLFLFHAYWDFSLLNDIFQRLEALKSKCYYEHQPSTSKTGISKTGTSKTRTCKTRTSKPFLFLHVTSS